MQIIENWTELEGRVTRSHDGEVTLTIEAAHDVPGVANLLGDRVGQTIVVQARGEQPAVGSVVRWFVRMAPGPRFFRRP